MNNPSKQQWYASTPAGTRITTTAADSKDQCIANLLKEAAYMPYKTWENFKARGYTVDEWAEPDR